VLVPAGSSKEARGVAPGPTVAMLILAVGGVLVTRGLLLVPAVGGMLAAESRRARFSRSFKEGRGPAWRHQRVGRLHG
jgi:hypothetical protein